MVWERFFWQLISAPSPTVTKIAKNPMKAKILENLERDEAVFLTALPAHFA